MSMPYSQYARLTQAFPVSLLTPGLVLRLVRRRMRPEVRRPRSFREARHATYRGALARLQHDREMVALFRL